MHTNTPFQTVQRPNAVEDVIQSFQQALLTGNLQPGEKLPSEAELGRQFGVGRGTVREAMKMLSAMGVIEIRRGDGTYVCDTISPKVINPLLFAVLMEASDVDALYEFRRMIDVGYTQIAAAKATDEDFAHMTALIDEMKAYRASGERDEEQLMQLDLSFHCAVLEATKNPLVIKTGRMVMEMFRETVKQAISTPGGVSWTIEQHERLLVALQSRDPHLVREAVEIGLSGSQTRQES